MRRAFPGLLLAFLLGAGWAFAQAAGEHGAPTRIYVETLRLVSEDGPAKPDFTQPLRQILALRGYALVKPVVDNDGKEKLPGDLGTDVYRVTRLVLSESTLNMRPASKPSSDMTVSARLVAPDGSTTALGPFRVHVDYQPSEVLHDDITKAGLDRAYGNLYGPVADAIDRLTP